MSLHPTPSVWHLQSRFEELATARQTMVRDSWKAVLTGVRLHELRHTHASFMLKQGEHPKVVQERLGHATIAVTLDTYSHVVPGMQAEAVQRLGEAFTRAQMEAEDQSKSTSRGNRVPSSWIA